MLRITVISFCATATKILAKDVSDARRSFTDNGLQVKVNSIWRHLLVAGYVLSDLLARYRRAFLLAEISAIEDNGSYLEHLLVCVELDIVAVMVIPPQRRHFYEILKPRPIDCGGCRSAIRWS